MKRRSFIATALVALGLRKKHNLIIPLGSPLSADSSRYHYRVDTMRYWRGSCHNPASHGVITGITSK